MNLDPLLSLLSQHTSISGAALADAIGVSRAAVWKQIDRLRELGLDIEAQAGTGYTLKHPLQLLDAATIRQQLGGEASPLLTRLQIVNAIASTSAELLAHVPDTRSGTVLLAEAQTAGRGQRGRKWQSPFASGFLGSVLWRFDRGLASLGGLSLAMGVAVADALAVLGAKVQLKWPNDVVTGEGKLGGLLIDAGGEAQGTCHAVIGLGLNGRLPATARRHIDQPAIDLVQLLGREVDRNELAAQLLTHLLLGLRRFSEQGFTAFHTRFQRLDALRGRTVSVRIGDSVHTGTADGVDDSARLCVTIDGKRRSFDVGLVSVRGVP